MRSLLLCLIAIVSVFALLPDPAEEKTFAPEVPQIYLHNVMGSNNSFMNLFQKSHHHIKHSEALALAYVEEFVQPGTHYLVKDSYETDFNGVRHVYLRQTVHDLEILNGDLNINVWDRKVLSIGSSFYKFHHHVPEPKPVLSSLEALSSLAQFLGDDLKIEELTLTQEVSGKTHKHTFSGYPKAVSDVKVELAYMQVDDGKHLELVWTYEIDVYDDWWNAMVSAEDGEIIALFDWVDSANYNVYPVGINDPNDGARVNVQNPAVSNASPLGWHDRSSGRTSTQTVGNNAYCQENWSGGSAWENNYRPDGAAALSFNFPINFANAPRQYGDAAISNLFYWNNIIHDIFYQYGFTEVSGNFQEFNFNRGGLGNDAVQANAQDGAGFNNANFATPPDGQRPRMRMYVWNRSTPNRDGDLDNGIIIHEYGHGISQRLTGGPSNVNCLSTAEAGGMGEGWGDWWGTALRQKQSNVRTDVFPMALYSNLAGIRNYPYTTNMNTNPETYNYITRSGYTGVHAKGAVWAGILWEVYWNFVDQYGFSTNWYQGEGGNNRIFRNVVDGLKLQPCRPTFVSARDAILQADTVNYGGANTCLLWRGFAKRGLGTGAVAGGTQSFDVPANCR